MSLVKKRWSPVLKQESMFKEGNFYAAKRLALNLKAEVGYLEINRHCW